MSDTPKYPQWFINMCQDILDMRDAQKDYFKQQNEHRLKVAKIREQKVDNGLQHYINEGLIKHKTKPKDIQKNLFE